MEKQPQDAKKKPLENNELRKTLSLENGFCLDSIMDICIPLSYFLDIDKLAAFVVEEIVKLFKARKCSFMLLDEVSSELSIKAAKGLNPLMKDSTIKLGESFSGLVVKEGYPLLVKDVEEEFPHISKDRLSRYQTKSFIILPIKSKDRILGTLSLTDKEDGDVFTDDDLKVLSLISYFAALQIENIRLQQKMENFSNIDNLTGLLNHISFQERLNNEIYRAERYRHPLSILMFDIDNFRVYNQTYGYSTGDSVLKEIANLIEENTRKTDIISRYGPEEFAVILPEIKWKEAVVVADKLREKIAASVFAKDRNSSLDITRLTVSLGVAEYKIGLGKEEFIKHAESALAEAKQRGKNRVSVYR